MFKEENYDINQIIKDCNERNIVFTDEAIFLCPEMKGDDGDILNEYTPDLFKIIASHGHNTVVVKSDNIKYLAQRDASIILPLIIGIPFTVLSSVISHWIISNFRSNDNIRLRFVKKNRNGDYKKIDIEGTPHEIKDIISELKDC